jgi:hypothetical protein
MDFIKITRIVMYPKKVAIVQEFNAVEISNFNKVIKFSFVDFDLYHMNVLQAFYKGGVKIKSDN